MDVQIDKTRREDAAGQVLHTHAWVVGRQILVRPHSAHHGSAGGIGPDHQQPVFVINGGMIVGKSQDGGAVGMHGA